MVAAVQQWEAAALQWVVGVPAQVREEGAEAQTPQQLRTQEVEDLVGASSRQAVRQRTGTLDVTAEDKGTAAIGTITGITMVVATTITAMGKTSLFSVASMTMGTIRIIPTMIAISGGGSTYGMDGDGVAFMFAIRSLGTWATPRLADNDVYGVQNHSA